MLICTNHREETAVYAAEELKKYLDLMHHGLVSGIAYTENARATEGTIVLGLMSEFGLETSEMRDPMTDDILYVAVRNGEDIIAGSNIRSILLSVYRYLREAGCRFLRPGKNGEVIPRRDMSSFSCKYRHVPSYPFRGECIEGAVTVEHVIDTIVWSPKVGMNMFMIQQVVPYNLMSRWYKHYSNTIREDENLPFEAYCEFTAEMEKMIRKVGLQYHSPGHGYLLEPWGVHYLDRYTEYHLSEEAVEATALVNGKRGLFENSPNFTQLCYSRDEIRKKLVDWLVAFVEKKPFLDFLHIWLSDLINNQCECESCKPHRISDLYVKLLNELDEGLTAKGLDTKVVFILYTDTNWPPLHETIKNPDRFIMLTAIGGRKYTETYDGREYEGETPSYEKNNYKIVTDFPLIRRFIEEWKPAFDGPKFSYEYHMYTSHYNDPGYMHFSKLFLRDCKTIGQYGYGGIMNCMTQRAAFPTSLPIVAYAEGMYDTDTEFEALAEYYFKHSFGEDYQLAKDYLTEVSGLMDYETLTVRVEIAANNDELGTVQKIRVKPWVNNPRAQNRFREAMKLADAFGPVAKAHSCAACGTVARSWELLTYHTDYLRCLAEIYLVHSQGDHESAKEKYEALRDKLSGLEPVIASDFDLHLFDNLMRHKLEL